jgi:integrase
VRKDAEAWAREMEVQADRRDLPRDPKVLQRITLGQLVERYRDTVSVRKRGYDVERIVLNAFLRHRICRKPLSEIEASDFASYRDERLMKITASTLKRELAPLHNMFELARDEWGLPLRDNPLRKVRVRSVHLRRERRLKHGELDQLIQAAQMCRNPLILPIILFAVETGMRRSEILSLRREHIDQQGRSILLSHTKNGHSRIVPITDAAAEIVAMVPMREDRIFPITSTAFRLAWDRLRKRAGIIDLHFHDLRHEAISRFFERGLTVPEVALLSGHRDARMLFRYTHPDREHIMRKLKH